MEQPRVSPSRKDEEGFLQAIRRDPEDPVPRLIFADWLEEQGDPRGEFIRQHCEYEEHGETDGAVVRARQQLEQQQRRTLIARLSHLGVRDVRFRGGFVDKVFIQGAEFLRRPNALFRHAPVLRGLMLRGISADRASDVMRRLAGLEKLSQLDALDLTDCNLGGAAIEALVSGVLRPTRLVLTGNPLGGHGLQVLTQAETLRGLESLELANAQLQVYDARQLSFSTTLSRLKSVNLSGNQIADGGLRRLAFAENMRGLETLELANAEIGPDGLRSWSEGPALTTLRSLNLSGNALGDVGCVLLSSASNAARLKQLRLAACEIDVEGFTALSRSPYLRGVSALQLDDNRFEQGLPDLSAAFAGLQDLSLARCGLADGHLPWLADAQFAASLRRLDLRGNRLTDRGLQALLASPLTGGLEQLSLADNPISASALADLRAELGPARVA